CTAHARQCWQQSRPLSFPIGSARAEPSLLADGADGAVKSPMVAAANLVEVAALVGDTARATILAALMGGQALTGSELAYLARVSRPTASQHLLRSPGRPGRRRHRRRARREWAHHPYRGRRRGDGCGRALSDRIRCEPARARQTNLLPALSRLERAPISCRGSCGRGDLAAL